MVDKVHEVLHVMAQLGINLVLFLDTSQELPSIPPGSSNARSAGAMDVMMSFAHECYLTVSPLGDDIVEDHLTGVVFMDLIEEVKKWGPFLWSILYRLACREDQLVRNTHKKPDKIILMIISMLSYTQSHHRGCIQKLFAIYFKFHGLTAKGFDILHALGLTMSHKWTCNAMLWLMDIYPWLLTYDNLNIPFHVFSQHLDNQGDFGSAMCSTVPLSQNANCSLQETHTEGLKNSLTPHNIILLSIEAYPCIHTHTKYQHHITLQFLLRTVNIPKASYEDNTQAQSPEMQQMLGMERLIACVGDQLTVDRLHNLFKFQAEDLNSFDRLDWILFTFGWFHLLMAAANSFHRQYLGTAQGCSLSQAFYLLAKKGLGSVSTKGPFYHDLNETLYTVAAAHLCEDWLLLVALADQIVEDCASSSALEHIDARPENQQDEVHHQTIMWNHNILQYIVLDQAVKHSDVGLMEDSLPHLDFIQNHCWLANNTGKRNDFLPFD
ncbi:hypothetical protein L208DRAFT_1425069 [Tricholoma matsutake]|nr:hypothetical protein L208DRAFT_1425069 [Tricholoma matsutake 945]